MLARLNRGARKPNYVSVAVYWISGSNRPNCYLMAGGNRRKCSHHNAVYFQVALGFYIFSGNRYSIVRMQQDSGVVRRRLALDFVQHRGLLPLYVV